MKRLSKEIIDDFGGIKALADLVKAPVSTANSWRHRITDSRLDHLRLAAIQEQKVIRWDTLGEAADESEAA
jgi:hypothetical protein